MRNIRRVPGKMFKPILSILLCFIDKAGLKGEKPPVSIWRICLKICVTCLVYKIIKANISPDQRCEPNSFAKHQAPLRFYPRQE